MTAEEILELPLKQLEREHNVRPVDDAQVKELAESIKEHGILEPVLVAPNGETDRYQLIAGYRRCRAAELAGLRTVPARVVPEAAAPMAFREIQLLENLQRTDLTPLQEARILQELCADGRTQKEVGASIGKSQPYIANRIRLLGLPEEGQELLEKGTLTPHLAAEILKLPDDAATERKRLLRRVSEYVLRDGEISPREFRWAVDSAKQSYTDRVERAKKIASAKFPTCPAKDCGKKGSPPHYYGETGFRCSAGHRWDPKSGKLAPKDRDRSYRLEPPAKPTLPEVDGKVLTDVTVPQIAKRILESVKDHISFELRWHNKTRAVLTLVVDAPAAKGARIPDFALEVGHKFIELDSARWQPDDDHRKQAAEERGNLEAWLGTFGKAGRPAKSKEAAT